MRRLTRIVLGIGLVGLAALTYGAETLRVGPVPGRFVVKLRRGVDALAVGQAAGMSGALTRAVAGPVRAELASGEGWERVYVLQGEATSGGDVVALLGAENVEWVEPEYYIQMFGIPSDSLRTHQWYLLNEGQEYYGIKRVDGEMNDSLVLKQGVAGKDIGLIGQYLSPPSDTSGKVVVGIIDSGVDTEHPELAGRIWRNVDELPGNHIDDDRNGYVDDAEGYDMSGDTSAFPYPEGDGDPSDDDGHGTHVAGIVGANADGRGTVGVAPWVEVMPVKIMPNGTTAIGAEAIVYAVNNGARIINASWGTPFASQVLREALDFARRNGVLVCMASGNSGDATRFYPAAFDLDSTLVVGAGDSYGDLTWFSTYGAHIDLIAPGLDILSLRAEGTDMYEPYPSQEPRVRIIDEFYYLSDGTSMASPVAAGAAALIWSFHPELGLDGIVQVMEQGATDLVDPLVQGDTLPGPDTLSGWGYLNVEGALGLATSGGVFVAEPAHRSRHTGPVTIKGGRVGEYSGGWVLEYAIGAGPEPGAWVALAAGDEFPADSVLAVFDDPSLSGIITLRLSHDFGRAMPVTFTYTRANTLDLVSPVGGEVFEYSIPVYGSAYGPDYDSAVVRCRNPRGVVGDLHASTAEYFDSLLYAWPVSGSDTGAFTILLYGYFSDSVRVDSAAISIQSTFANGWPRALPGLGGMTAISCDLNGDGRIELAAATTRGLIMYHADDGTVVPGFPVLDGRDVRCVPAVYDTDRDGEEEIIITDSSGIHVFNWDGTYASGWPQACLTGLLPYEYAYPAPVVVQFREVAEEGAAPDSGIVLVNTLGRLVAYRFSGEKYFYSREMFGQFDARVSYSFGMGGDTSPMVTSADFDGDGRREIVATFSSPDPYTGLGFFQGANGEPAFGLPVPTAVTVRWMSGGTLGDFDGDGYPEVVVSGLGVDGLEHMWIRTKDNREFASWVVPVDESWNGWIASYPVLADLDLDGVPEILAAYFEFDKSSLFIYRADGTPYIDPPRGRPGEALYSPDVTFGTPAVADLVGDEHPEIIIRSGHLLPGAGAEQVYLLDYMLEPVPGWPKATPAPYGTVASSRQAALVDDIDNDGLVEMALLSDDGRLLVWDFASSSRGGTNRFRFLYDNRNTSVWAAQGSGVGIPTPTERRPATKALSAQASPFRADGKVRFHLEKGGRVRVEIFDIRGRVPVVPVDEYLEAGEHEIEFDGSSLVPGAYFYRVTAHGEVIARQMLLMK